MTTLDIPRPGPLISMNDRDHWRAKATKVKTWRWVTRCAAAKVGPHPPCTVTITLDVTDNRRRDPHNYYPTIKAIIDGLVDAGIWPDDTPEWVTTVEPVLRVIHRNDIPRAWITLTERPAP